METTELVLTFIADLAWPAVVITMFLLLRHPIKALIAKITDIIFKKGDTEVRVNIAKALKAIGELDKEKPGDISLENVTPDNLNWDIFIRTIVSLHAYAVLYLNFVPLDKVNKDPDFHRICMHTIEVTFSLFKTYKPAAGFTDADNVISKLRRRLSSILDNPS